MSNTVAKESIARLDNQIRSIGRILEMNTDGMLDSNTREELTRIKKEAEELKEKLEKGIFEIAIVGLEKAGKSTFAGALIGKDIFPSEEERCTYTTTTMCYGNDEAEVIFYSRNEYNDKFRANLKKMGYPGADNISFDRLSETDYEKEYEKLDESVKSSFRSTTNEDIIAILKNIKEISSLIGSNPRIFNGAAALNSDELKNFIIKPEYALAVKEIIIKSSQLQNMKEAVIYDVPGFDSPTAEHSEQTVAKMKRADVILLIASADKPSQTGPVVDIFKKGQDLDGTYLKDKMFVFANRADKAENLKKNLETLKSELKKYQIMNPDKFSRVIEGSARARLEELGLRKGSDATDALNKHGVSNGVEKLKGMLEEYNREERIIVLNARIQRAEDNIKSLFQKLFDEYNVDGEHFNNDAYTELFMELIEKLPKIAPKLDDYKGELSKKYGEWDDDSGKQKEISERPLSKKLLDEVVANITPEKFGVTKEELTIAKNEAIVQTGETLMTKVELILREKKFSELIKFFVERVSALAEDEHETCDNELIQIFLNDFNITKNSIYAEELSNDIRNIINGEKYVNESKGYYKSLIERFSSSLFEILIKTPYGYMDRWRYFKKDATNFYSISMFDKNRDLTKTPDKQPLHYLMLFHENSNGEVAKALVKAKEHLMNLLDPQKPLSNEILLSLGKLALALKSDIYDYVKNTFVKKDEKYVETKLNNEISKREDEGFVFKDLELTDESYDNYFDGKRAKTLENVTAEIADDIKILQSILRDAVVNAISLEKPFLSYEFFTINNLKECLEINNDSQFKKMKDFIKQNQRKLMPEKYAGMDEDMERRQNRIGILREIKAVLAELDN